ncbi:MAG: type II toxin-antitoxin system VapC family toxin [Acidobacteria bacterium]|nr:type II toxin-antitoxin system VapC family toxin [Acidobacteriota bacterium]
MTLYAESSAVLFWLLGQPRGDAVWRSFQRADGVFTSDLTLVEADRALHRLAAAGALDAGDTAAARARLENVAATWVVHRITPRVVDRSRGAFPREPIRSLDAIHLATALVIRDVQPGLSVLSLDRRLRENAVAVGFEVVPDGI